VKARTYVSFQVRRVYHDHGGESFAGITDIATEEEAREELIRAKARGWRDPSIFKQTIEPVEAL